MNLQTIPHTQNTGNNSLHPVLEIQTSFSQQDFKALDLEPVQMACFLLALFS